MELRSYQNQCIAKVLKQLEVGNALVSVGTGGGKSIIFSKLVSILEMSGTVLILTNQVKLVTQGYDNLKHFNDDIGIFNASLNKKELKRITISTIQSITKITTKWDYILLDEGHNFDERTGMFKRFVDFQGYKPRYVSFTSTPFGFDEYIYGPNRLFKSVTYQKTVKDLTPEFLVPLKHCNGKDSISTEGLKIIAGDYLKSQLSERVLSDYDKLKRQVTDALSRCRGRTVWCCISIEHAEAVHKLIPDSIIVHSKGNKSLDGGWKHVVSVMMITEGIDIPSLETIVWMRPTRSPRLYAQAVGRVLRQHESKTSALLLDYGRVIENLGDIYNVGPNTKPSLRLCIECESFSPMRMNKCHYCGEQFQTQCAECFSMKAVGVPCGTCTTKERKQSALLSNLSDTAHSDYKVVNVDCCKVYKHTKNNIDMLKVCYYNGIDLGSTEYFDRRNPYRAHLFKQWLMDCTTFESNSSIEDVLNNLDKIVAPSKLVLKKNKKWFNVIERIYD